MVPEDEKKEQFIRMRISKADKARIRQAMEKTEYKGHEQDFIAYLLELGLKESEWEQEVIAKARAERAGGPQPFRVEPDTRQLTDEDLDILGRGKAKRRA